MSKLKLVLSAFRNQKLKFLMVFLVILLTLLIFNISSSLQKSVVDTRMGQLRELTDNSQVVVSKSDGTYAGFDKNEFLEHYLEPYNESNGGMIEDFITRTYCYVGIPETEVELFLFGTDVVHQNEIYKFDLESGDISDWEQYDIMLSSEFAKEYNYQVGDAIEIQHGDAKATMKIRAISKDAGMFRNAGTFGLTSQEFLDEFAEREGLVNRIDLTLANLDEMDQFVSEMNEALTEIGLSATAKYSISYFHAYVTTVVLALNIFSIFLVLLAVYMLYSLFQSYVYENVGQMATLRSIGYSITEYRTILCMQVFTVVLFAFVCSVLLTPLAIKIFGGIMFQQNTKVVVNYGTVVWKALIVFAIAIVSIYLASYKISKTSTISLIRNNVSYQKTHFNKLRCIIAFICLGVTIGCYVFQRKEGSLYLNYTILFGISITFILFQDVLIRIYATIISRILRNRKRTLGLFGKQVKTTLISYLPAVTAVAFVLSISMVILSMMDILNTAMDKMYSGADMCMTIYDSNYDRYIEELEQYEEVDSYIVERRKKAEINDTDVIVASVADDWTVGQYEMVVDSQEAKKFQDLSEENNVIISDTLSKKWNMEKGEKLVLEEHTFSIAGVVKTFENMGEIIFISQDSFLNTWDNYDYCTVLITSKEGIDLDTLKTEMQSDLESIGDARISTIEEMSRDNKKSNQVIMKAIFAFAIIIILVSGIGLCSVVMISILLRQREFIVYQTVGIPKSSILKIGVLEALSISFYGFINAIVVQHFILKVIVEILSYYVGSLEASGNLISGVKLLAGIVVLTTVVIVGVTKKYALTEDLIEKIKVS